MFCLLTSERYRRSDNECLIALRLDDTITLSKNNIHWVAKTFPVDSHLILIRPAKKQSGRKVACTSDTLFYNFVSILAVMTIVSVNIYWQLRRVCGLYYDPVMNEKMYLLVERSAVESARDLITMNTLVK